MISGSVASTVVQAAWVGILIGFEVARVLRVIGSGLGKAAADAASMRAEVRVVKVVKVRLIVVSWSNVEGVALGAEVVLVVTVEMAGSRSLYYLHGMHCCSSDFIPAYRREVHYYSAEAGYRDCSFKCLN